MKTIKVMLTSFLFLVLTTLISSEAYAQAPVKRLMGKNRYDTAVAISNEGWEKSNYAVITCGENYPDAIAVTPLAMKYNAPILLTGTSTLN